VPCCALSNERGDPCAVGKRERPLADVTQLIARTRDADLPSAAESARVATEPLASFGDVLGVAPARDRIHMLAPIRPPEVWAAGVRYETSRDARLHESSECDVYERVYEAERPELFLKATGRRVVGPNARVGLRSDSASNVPELGLVLGTNGAVLG